MVIYVTKAGSERKELEEVLTQEGVTFQECPAGRERELGSPLLEVQANLPEVYPVPPEFVQSEGDVRVWRLPSGRVIITDMEGNLDRIATPRPSR
ncbi:MAG: hypothetical protein ACOZFS_10005 [Thermodesulfobacteriota bacterium]